MLAATHSGGRCYSRFGEVPVNGEFHFHFKTHLMVLQAKNDVVEPIERICVGRMQRTIEIVADLIGVITRP
jgi:hypothetical protein